MSIRTVPAVLSAVFLGTLVSGCASDAGSSLKGAQNIALPTTPVMRAAVSGGLISGAIGNGLDDTDRQRAYDAEISALETGSPGYPIGWKGESGTRGTVIAGPSYHRPGFLTCRDYSHTIYINNRPQIARGAACRNTDGKWQAVS